MKYFRERLLLIAAITTLTSLFALVLVDRFAPAPAATKGWHFDASWYGAVTGLISSLLSVGVISLIAELFLRESYATGLRRFLNLNTAVVKSGLQSLDRDAAQNPAELVGTATKIRALIRDPQRWATRYLQAILDDAKDRAVDVTLLLPDADSKDFNSLAASLDTRPDQLNSDIKSTIDLIQKQWGASLLHKGSQISICTVGASMFEILVLDDRTVISLGSAIGSTRGESQLVLTFDSKQYPGTWFRTQLEQAPRSGEVWAAAANATRPSGVS